MCISLERDFITFVVCEDILYLYWWYFVKFLGKNGRFILRIYSEVREGFTWKVLMVPNNHEHRETAVQFYWFQTITNVEYFLLRLIATNQSRTSRSWCTVLSVPTNHEHRDVQLYWFQLITNIEKLLYSFIGPNWSRTSRSCCNSNQSRTSRNCCTILSIPTNHEHRNVSVKFYRSQLATNIEKLL